MNDQLRDEQLRLLWLSRIDYEKNSGVEKHSHEEFYQLLLIINGYGRIHIEDQPFEINPHDCYLIPPFKEHQFIFSSKTNTIDFKFKVLNKKLNSLFMEKLYNIPIHCNNIEDFKDLFRLTSYNIKHPNNLISYQIEVGLKELLLSLIIESNGDDKITPEISYQYVIESPINKIIDYLKAHLGEEINLDILSKYFGFHPHYIIQLFNKAIGNSPIKVLQILRMEKAKEYLEFTSYSINEIAEKIGLSTPYFSRLFKEREQLSPSQYREQSRTIVGKDIILTQDFSTTFQTQPKITTIT